MASERIVSNRTIIKYSGKCSSPEGKKCNYSNNGTCLLFNIQKLDDLTCLNLCNNLYGLWYTGNP